MWGWDVPSADVVEEDDVYEVLVYEVYVWWLEDMVGVLIW